MTTGTSPDESLDAFFHSYYARRPVNATFTGVHEYDAVLPDWSPEGLDAMAQEMRALRVALGRVSGDDVLAPASGTDATRRRAPDWRRVDAALADAFLEVQLAELAGSHFQRGNPSLAVGEAVFSVVALITRDFAPASERAPSVEARLRAMPVFLDGALQSLAAAPLRSAWRAKALQEAAAGVLLVRDGVALWCDRMHLGAAATAAIVAAGDGAATALQQFAAALERLPATDGGYGCGEEMLALLLSRGHWCDRSLADLLSDARERLAAERRRLDERARAVHPDGWPGVQEALASRHPEPGGYLDAFSRCWSACRALAEERGLVTWPDYPIDYVEIPEWTRAAAPTLYYLFYRSPAPFDHPPVVEYVVTPLPPGDAARQLHLRAWNDSVIKLNHVVHHGSIGHHVQNWYAQRAPSRVGQMAAADCASRIGMFSGGSMAEGWACYATDLMDEAGFLTPLESVAEQHTRVRMLARMVVDIELHAGAMSFDEAIAFYGETVGMSAAVARNEAVKNSMFPGTAMMYWLGTQAIHELRRDLTESRGSAFSLRDFHDELLGCGSIPVLLAGRLLRGNA